MRRLYDALPVFAQNWACGIEGRKRFRERFTPEFFDTLARWERTAGAPASALRSLQSDALRELVQRARGSSAYWRALPPPSDGANPEEAIARTLAAIPPLEKSTLRDRSDELVLQDVPPAERVRLKTSGTTGSALVIWQTRRRIAESYAVVWRQRRGAGVALEDPHFTFGGQPIVPLNRTRPPFWRRNAAARQILFSSYHLAPRFLPAYVDAIHALPARYAQGYPSALHLVATALLDAGRPLPVGRLAAVFTSSETLHPFQRRTIERGFGAPVHDYYSSAESAVAMTGCAAGRLHVDAEFGIVEVEVAERGPDWERGPLLVTGLGAVGTALLRYRIGDVGTRALGDCPCGRTGDSFIALDGRIEDYVVTPDGRRIGRMDHVFKDMLSVSEAQIVQDTPASIEVLVVPRLGWSDRERHALEVELRGRLGTEISIEIRCVDAIPREPSGKLRAVRSRVGALGA